MENVDNCFPFLKVPTRSPKPRTTGLTLFMDWSLSTSEVEGLMEHSAEILDYAKLVDHAATALRHSRSFLKKKFEIYHKHQVKVFMGGVIYQVAALQDQVRPFMETLKDVGFDAVEVSEDVMPGPYPLERRIADIKLGVELGLEVMTEVGKKDPEAPIDPDYAISYALRDFESGAKMVTVENSDTILLMKTDPTPIFKFVEAIGLDRIRFEVGPTASGWPNVAAWVIKNFGPEVNLENVHPHWIGVLDGMRRGMARPVQYEFTAKRGAKL